MLKPYVATVKIVVCATTPDSARHTIASKLSGCEDWGFAATSPESVSRHFPREVSLETYSDLIATRTKADECDVEPHCEAAAKDIGCTCRDEHEKIFDAL
jgi:hypothetical protein